MTAGRNIRALRRRSGLTQGELAALCGLSRDDVGKYERGEMTPRPRTAAKLAAALDVPVSTIRGGIDRTETVDTLLSQGIREALGEDGVTLPETDLPALLEAVKASLPALVEHRKDRRSEEEITRALLSQETQPPALTDEQWAALSPLIPPENAGRGRAYKSNRLMLEAILLRMQTGISWRQLPERYGRGRCAADRLRLWQETGVWPLLAEKLTALGLLE